MTFEELSKVNKNLPTVDIKGKNYAQVNNRVLAFRELFPNGSITTEILHCEGGVVTMQATCKDEEGRILSSGLAYEKESSSFINKTSYIENCETSAVGRALGFLGIGVDGSMCSAEELVNAVTNQSKDIDGKITKAKLNTLVNMCKSDGVDEDIILNEFGVDGLDCLTNSQFVSIANNWSKKYKKCEAQEK